jgi:hypothetical protein
MIDMLNVAQVNYVWRFFNDSGHNWRWQCLTVANDVILESETGFSEYEKCIADAQKNGYVLQNLSVAYSRPKSKVTVFPWRGRKVPVRSSTFSGR